MQKTEYSSEILFRGKNEKGEYVEGDLIHTQDVFENNETYIFSQTTPSKWQQHRIPDTETIGRFTGYIYNTKKVYENDRIFRDSLYGIIRYGRYRSEFDSPKTEHCGFYVEWIGIGSSYLRKDLGYWMNENVTIKRED